MNRKIIGMILSLVLVISSATIFSGCKNSGKTEVTIGIWPEAHLTYDNQVWNEWKTRFEAENPKYEIVPQPYSYSPDTFFSLANSGMAPTVFITWFTEPQKLISNKFVKDITPQLSELGWLDKMDDFMKEAMLKDGKVYGVPQSGYGLGLMLNLKLLEEVGVVSDIDGDGVVDIHNNEGEPLYPTTFDELYEVSELIDQYTNAKGMVILSAKNTGGWQFSNIAWNFGAQLQSFDDGKWTANINSSYTIEALEWIKKMKVGGDTGYLPSGTVFDDSDWFTRFGTNKIAMCITGSDNVTMPVTNVDMDINDIAFVPMPAGPRGDRYSLFGGSPYMFAGNATDDQIMGALKFLEFIGKSPVINDNAIKSIEDGYALAKLRNLPIMPSIKAWKDPEYLAVYEKYEKEKINVNLNYYKDFFNSINDIRKREEPNYAQEMYGLLDTAIQGILSGGANSNVSGLLATANSNFQTNYLNKL